MTNILICYYCNFTLNKRWKAKWIGHILLKKYLLKCVICLKIEGKIYFKGRRRRRRKQVLYDLKEIEGYWKLNKRKR